MNKKPFWKCNLCGRIEKYDFKKEHKNGLFSTWFYSHHLNGTEKICDGMVIKYD